LRKKSSYFGDFSLELNSVEELDEIIVIDRKPHTKCWEFDEGIKAIKANPNEYFSNTGGNRGVEWWINGQ